MTMHRLRLLLTLAALSLSTGAGMAQSAAPAPSPEERDACARGYASLREDAEAKGKMIREAGVRHAAAEESCKIISAYSTAEVKIMKYVEANAAGCSIPGSVMEQLKAGHKNTEGLLQKVCSVAEQIKTRGTPGQINDFGDPAFGRSRF
jgi:hypothetical protein